MTGFHSSLEAILQTLETAGGRLCQAPTLLEARILVELSGEAVRPRLCRFSGPDGEELCLRPDMTVPLCMVQGSGRVHYSGPVWLFPQSCSGEEIEVAQAGFEWFGGGGAEEDAEAVCLTLQAARAAGVKEGKLLLSDMGIWDAVIASMDMPGSWRIKLASHWRGGIQGLLSRVTRSGSRKRPLPVSAVRGNTGRRRAEDIEQRLKALETLSPEAQRLLTELGEISGPPDQAIEQIACLTAGLGADKALERLIRVWDLLKQQAPPLLEQAHFAAVGGGRFDYYDGLMFELIHPALGAEQALARGGRYDGLSGRLGKASMQAIGAALRPDRLDRGSGK